MTPAITLEELVAWDHESAVFWKAHLGANPALLRLPCGIGGAADVQEFVRHIWAVELRWGQLLAGLPVLSRKETPAGPLEALFVLHLEAMRIFGALLGDPAQDWGQTINLTYDWLSPEARNFSRRKIMSHALVHSQRHWAQLSTLLRAAGFPTNFRGDLLFSSTLI
jgi:uncharacterized damage-inducible protein DinB